MIIQLSVDADTVNLCHALLLRHKDELFQINSLSLVSKEGDIVTEKDGSPIKRISIMAHANFERIGGVLPEVFAHKLISCFQHADEVSPGTSAKIHTIDLIGCHAGYVSPEGEGTSLEIAKRLLAAGYTCKINSLTNISHPHPYPVHRLLLIVRKTPRDSGALHLIIRSEEQDRLFLDTLTKKKRVYELSTQIQEQTNQLDLLEAVERSEEFELTRSELHRDRAASIEELKRITDEINRLDPLGGATPNVFTYDLRASLDSDPQCNMSLRAMHHLGASKGRLLLMHQAATDGDVDALEQAMAKEASSLDLPDPSGCTALYRAAVGNHPEAIAFLLSMGANPHLLVSFDKKTFFDSLAPDELDIAKHLRVEYSGGQVRITPKQIAQIYQYHAVAAIFEAHEKKELSGDDTDLSPRSFAFFHHMRPKVGGSGGGGSGVSKESDSEENKSDAAQKDDSECKGSSLS